ncbi:MAG: class I SAM-dependent DNA methyltransferase [Ruminococcus sp.]|nr:class I SAM-dependent DNA methyltransferase [Ruminococcus sp.]
MTDKEQKAAAKEFAKMWAGKGDEKQDTHRFWMGFLQKVLGVANADEHIKFEKPVQYKGHTTYIDAYIPETRVLIEQKSLGIDLDKKEPRHGEELTPFEQAEQYSQKLPLSEKAHYIIVSNFETFRIHDLDKQGFESNYEEIKLCDLEKECHRFGFIIDKNKQMLQREMEISNKAGILVGKLREAILSQYDDPKAPETLKSLNVLLVRLVFCMYAEDAGVFKQHEQFGQYLKQFPVEKLNIKLQELFEVLNTKPENRYRYIDEELEAFPYVNGGLFADNSIEIPKFTDEIVDLLINKASAGFDWSEISPPIFGAIFESTLNPETRRLGGMHYTSIENIHKVIDPLFLSELKTEFNGLIKNFEKAKSAVRDRKKHITESQIDFEAFRDKLASLTFLDPACGSGNFLTETYLSLRRLENEALKAIIECETGMEGQTTMSEANPIKVSINQFYGIEINDFAVAVANTALRIAESQMIKETEEITKKDIEFLPLSSYDNIVEGNALRIDWESVVPKDKLSYIMGNPPFVGGMYMDKVQKSEIMHIFDEVKGAGEMDYVCAWYKKAADIIKGKDVKVAFVSTNSICQGQQVITFWKYLFDNYNIDIDFAYDTFVWNNESNDQARVHCVIVGFSRKAGKTQKKLFDSDNELKICKNISPYLTDSPSIFIESRSVPLCRVSPIRFGSMPRDGGGFVLSEDQRLELIKKEPLAEKWIRPYVGAIEFLNNKKRYCLWLVGASPAEIKSCPTVLKRIDAIREFRASSKAAGTRKFAETPTLFCQIAQPDTDYIIVPKTSSGKRKYIPLGFMDKNTIASDLVFLIPNGTLYEFGVLCSNVHNAWMRTVAGRLKSDYRYSKDIVYNNFPWCSPTPEQKAKIEQTAQAILDARALYPDCSLADLYDELTMPPELRKAHQANDKAVMQAYGFKPDMPESDIVAELMKMYQKLTEGK